MTITRHLRHPEPGPGGGLVSMKFPCRKFFGDFPVASNIIYTPIPQKLNMTITLTTKKTKHECPTKNQAQFMPSMKLYFLVKKA